MGSVTSVKTSLQSRQVDTPDGISWYTETFRHGNSNLSTSNAEYMVLVPSGEGDCYNLRTIAELLASKGGYTVLTFDMPAMSRTTAPYEAYARVTPQLLAKQIIGLLDTLNIPRATFFGCSSGGSAIISICTHYSTRVKSAIVHEVPYDDADFLNKMVSWPDEKIIAIVEGIFKNMFIEHDVNDGLQKWEALGPEYHARLAKNYLIWTRNYYGVPDGWNDAKDPENLKKRPIFWTVGALNKGRESEAMWQKDFQVAEAAGLKVNGHRLNSLHFPAVTIPEDLTEWILECASSVKD